MSTLCCCRSDGYLAVAVAAEAVAFIRHVCAAAVDAAFASGAGSVLVLVPVLLMPLLLLVLVRVVVMLCRTGCDS